MKKRVKTKKTVNNKKDDKIKKKIDDTNINKIKSFISSYRFLYSVFIILLLIVIVLGIVVFSVSSEKKKTTGDILFAMMEDNIENEISLDLYELSNKKDYKIKVSNYSGNNINKKEIKYKLTINNNSGVDIKITLNDDDKNLINNKKNTVIDGKIDKGNDKKYDIYHVKVTSKNKVKKGDKVNIKINN